MADHNQARHCPIRGGIGVDVQKTGGANAMAALRRLGHWGEALLRASWRENFLSVLWTVRSCPRTFSQLVFFNHSSISKVCAGLCVLDALWGKEL